MPHVEISKNMSRQWLGLATLQEEHFHWNFNFAISLMENSLNLNAAYYNIFQSISLIAQAYITGTPKIKIR